MKQRNHNQKNKNQDGFTIIELMIATMVFSLVLLICTYGLIQIGRHFQKGVTVTRNQETARVAVEEISESLQIGGGDYVPLATTPQNVEGFCVGSKRFSYVLDRQLVTTVPTAEQSNRVLIVDELPNDDQCGASVTPQNLFAAGVVGREMLGQRMQLRELDVHPTGPTSANLFSISIKVATGENALFTGDSCQGGSSSSHFCATSEIETIVQKRK